MCHYYLAGMCPFEEFERTKHDVGPCPLATGHDDDLRAEFEVSSSIFVVVALRQFCGIIT